MNIERLNKICDEMRETASNQHNYGMLRKVDELKELLKGLSTQGGSQRFSGEKIGPGVREELSKPRLSPQGGEYRELVERLRVNADNAGYLHPDDRRRMREAADAIERLSVGTGLEGGLRDVVARLLDGIRQWAADEDGIPEALCPAFNEGMALLGWTYSTDIDVQALERAAPAPKEGWVKVEDADLSQRSDWLCYCWSDEQEYGLIDACQYVDGDFGMMTGWRVTHVRPLPPAPTQEGEER